MGRTFLWARVADSRFFFAFAGALLIFCLQFWVWPLTFENAPTPLENALTAAGGFLVVASLVELHRWARSHGEGGEGMLGRVLDRRTSPVFLISSLVFCALMWFLPSWRFLLALAGAGVFLVAGVGIVQLARLIRGRRRA